MGALPSVRESVRESARRSAKRCIPGGRPSFSEVRRNERTTDTTLNTGSLRKVMDVVLVGGGTRPIPPPGWGAVERAIDGLARGLRNLGIHVQIVNRVRRQRAVDEYRFAAEVARDLRQIEYDVIHASTPVVGNALAFWGLDYVYTSHSRHWTGPTRLTERFGHYLERRACRLARRTIALNEQVAEQMVRTGSVMSPTQIRVIPNGVDVGTYHPDWSSRTGRRILGVGAIHPRKRWHVAVRAVAGLPNIELRLVGPIQDRAYAESLRTLAGSTALTLVGEVGDLELVREYAQADLLVHPSHSELQSIAVLEAMASGLPVIGSEVLRPQVPAPGVGTLIPRGVPEPREVEMVRHALQDWLFDDSRRRLAAAEGRAYVARNHSWEVVAGQVSEVYREVMALSRRRPRPPRGSRPALS
jgi:glycosyltransferase involved in cell wall biosynthesis